MDQQTLLSRKGLGAVLLIGTVVYGSVLLLTGRFFLENFFIFDGTVSVVVALFAATLMLIPISLFAGLVGMWVSFRLHADRAALFFLALPVCVATVVGVVFGAVSMVEF